MTEPFSTEDFALLDAAFAAAVNPVPPPAVTRARILAAIQDVPHDSKTLRADEGSWFLSEFRGWKPKCCAPTRAAGPLRFF